MTTQASFSSSSSSSISYGWTYDVFLSFRGQDTGHGFTGNLYKALSYRGIRTFIDDRELHGGEAITPTLMKAIEESRIAIIVLSKNYASSSFCLEQLTKILDCFMEKGRLVLPVLYDVDPCHVRHHTGSYKDALAHHEERFKGNKDKMERLEKWKMALTQVANLSGRHFKLGNEYEHEFIGKIVKLVSSKINRVRLPIAEYPVGLESHVLQVNSLLEVGSNGVEMVGIYGIGGIGKTTLALAVYNFISDHFEGLCFLENVRENSYKHGLLNLQKAMLSKIFGEKEIEFSSINEGISIIQHRLRRKKVLLVLDDVDEQEQLLAIAGKLDWFGPGSRVIITTRNMHLLKVHGVDKIYEVPGLNELEASELLSWKAFKTNKVDPSYKNILNRAVIYASGHPLALELIGSNLFEKSVEEWESALAQYERIPVDRLHDLIEDMGKEIVREESPDDLGNRSRLWFHDDKIVKLVSSRSSRVPLPVADYPVGLESRMLQVNSLLKVGSDDGVEMVGIYGIGGIGKTTLALAVYNSIADQFHGLCFLENVRENFNQYGLLYLQKIVLSKIFEEKEIELSSIEEGMSIIQRRLKHKKVLLILDDVDNQRQLDSIAGKRDWFCSGSRVIITTRNMHLLKVHEVEKMYEVQGLDVTDSFKLLRWKAFKTDKIDPSYDNVLKRAVSFASGHPLSLELIGSNLFGRSVEEWESALDQYESIPP